MQKKKKGSPLTKKKQFSSFELVNAPLSNFCRAYKLHVMLAPQLNCDELGNEGLMFQGKRSLTKPGYTA